MTKTVSAGRIRIGGRGPLVLIAGPCVIESERSAVRHAKAIKAIAERLDIPYIYKSSYDKANRTSMRSYRGPGIKKGIRILKRVKEETGLPMLSDVHCKEELDAAARVLDVIQIPAFLSRQTDFIIAAAKTKKTINIKKGQFMAPWDVGFAIEKVESAGNRSIIITERGVSFGYNNLISDMRALPILAGLGYPVVYDATHSVQLPGGMGKASGGEGRFIPVLARAAVAAGCDGLFLEVHEDPRCALCDGPNSLALKDLEELLVTVKEIDSAVKRKGI
ncbi:MAG: 3-deoxy-8-phosphooctulonate synthase [Candidatus Omnitrophica bacterium]|nr:3-deoxy-8-phosphooctulonate synthase [Candidatus Omnitrophota bacterium]MDD5546797.1 3-deoxy-8-phosphooctulonate synthase [Candidatus Omnitrophota bacterium]